LNFFDISIDLDPVLIALHFKAKEQATKGNHGPGPLANLKPVLDKLASLQLLFHDFSDPLKRVFLGDQQGVLVLAA
jgi:hypothetical protein